MTPTFRINAGQRWRYIGQGDGHGVIHTVTGVFSEEAFDGTVALSVTTWSESFRAWDEKGDVGGGDSWMGPPESFVKQFVPVRSKDNDK